jgi:hypothetical protein
MKITSVLFYFRVVIDRNFRQLLQKHSYPLSFSVSFYSFTRFLNLLDSITYINLLLLLSLREVTLPVQPQRSFIASDPTVPLMRSDSVETPHLLSSSQFN